MSLDMTATPIGIGLVGYGYAGATLHAPLIVATPGLVLRAVASRQAARVQADLGAAVDVVDDPAALLGRDDIQALVIASPNDTHAPLARAALEAGRHAMVDKPFALDAAEAEPLLALAQARGRLLSVFHNRRFDGDFLTAQALLADGLLGRPVAARLRFDRFRPQVRARWREGDGPGAGLLMDLAPHLLDQALRLFGTPLSLAAELWRERRGALADDAFEIRLGFDGGLHATLGASMLTGLPGARFELHGELGSWIKHGLDPQEDALKAGHRPDPQRPPARHGDWGNAQGDDPAAGTLAVLRDGGDQALPQPWPNRPGRWPAAYAGWRDAIAGIGPDPLPAREALQVMRLIDLAREAAAARRVLEVPPAWFA